MTRRWRDRKDFYYFKAKAEGYRSRAAFKLKQIIKKFKVIRRGDVVVDLGAAPGGWLQVAREAVGSKGFVIGVDLVPITPLPWKNVKTIELDVTSKNAAEKIRELLPRGSADVLLSDLAPKVSGIWDLDNARQIFLAEKALEIADQVLRAGGNAVIKIFQGSLTDDFLKKVKKSFRIVKLYKPPASRKESAEIYVIAIGMRRKPHKSSREEH
ncbi:MAG: 23S rRNA (uridine(2552)-2'-O)-methyltransferase [Candidatus Methanomethylicota archaeon]|uniref:Ribosomal RNA large subunit methyltransferase E n=1 Tax=Thermoproteota archaeon TaxID=2056631 RepID=A0A497EZZ2_9CREN|nr:MAG: 23S rRNA (uridine(2552)-2'-O)-methyltransferase [Candidatus Verstraetearchaeota archaeon]